MDSHLAEETEKRRQSENRTRKNLLYLLVGFGVFILGSFCVAISEKVSKVQEAQTHIRRCYEKSAGADRKQSFEEQEQMARDLGYQGIIIRGIPITLSVSSSQDPVYISNYFNLNQIAPNGETIWRHEVPKNKLETYLANKNN